MKSRVQAQIFLSVDVQKTGTGNAAVAVPVPRFLQSGDFMKILVPVPVFYHIELKPDKFELSSRVFRVLYSTGFGQESGFIIGGRVMHYGR